MDYREAVRRAVATFVAGAIAVWNLAGRVAQSWLSA
jgi:hypothetical protein